jgi:glycosyltransferase involved in cell wall biosynthesis
MPGHVTQEVNISNVKNCSLLISPTIIESFGMAILEGLFCGLPAVSFDVGGVSDAVQHSYNGYLAPVGDVEKLTEYASKLFDDNLRNEFKENALKSAIENFNGNVVLKKYKEIFDDNLAINRSLKEIV